MESSPYSTVDELSGFSSILWRLLYWAVVLQCIRHDSAVLPICRPIIFHFPFVSAYNENNRARFSSSVIDQISDLIVNVLLSRFNLLSQCSKFMRNGGIFSQVNTPIRKSSMNQMFESTKKNNNMPVDIFGCCRMKSPMTIAGFFFTGSSASLIVLAQSICVCFKSVT